MRRHVGIGWLLFDSWWAATRSHRLVVDTGLCRADGRVLKHYHSLVNAISGDARRFAPYEHVHRVRLWLEEFRIGRELSQTLKLRGHEFRPPLFLRDRRAVRALRPGGAHDGRSVPAGAPRQNQVPAGPRDAAAVSAVGPPGHRGRATS